VQQRAEQAVWRSLGEYDLRPRLESLRVPSLVVHGEGDPIPIEGARATAEALGAEWLPLGNCGHVPYIEAADRLFPALARFLDGA
jgi:proline iminopeptidase